MAYSLAGLNDRTKPRKKGREEPVGHGRVRETRTGDGQSSTVDNDDVVNVP